MIIVKFSGGLGNQMYQYALYQMLKYYYPGIIVKADLSFYQLLSEHNGFVIDQAFQMKEKIIFSTKKEIVSLFPKYIPGILEKNLPDKLKKMIAFNLQYKFTKIKSLIRPDSKNYVLSGFEINTYNDLVFHLNVNTHSYYLDGLWQNIHYFQTNQELIKSSFIFQDDYGDYEHKISDLIKESNSVSIHIRQGDFIGSTLDICKVEYYTQAIKIMNSRIKNITWFVFSDSPSVSKNFINLQGPVIYVQGNKRASHNDMRLMSECKHNIISNSTFSFWASFLNKNKNRIVIAPKYCVKNTIGNYTFSLPDDYIKIEV